MTIRTKTWLTKNGKRRSVRLFGVWCGIRQRCLGKGKDNHNYKDRGISICNEWMNFDGFREWAINNGYRLGLTIERVNNDGNYEPSNCKFIPRTEQAKNTRRLVHHTYRGQTRSIAQWARYLGVTPSTMQYRLSHWIPDKTFTRHKFIDESPE